MTHYSENAPYIIGVTCPPFWDGVLCAVLTSPAGSYACNHDIGQACWVSVKRSNAGCYAHSIVTDYFVSRQKHCYHLCLRKVFLLLSQSSAKSAGVYQPSVDHIPMLGAIRLVKRGESPWSGVGKWVSFLSQFLGFGRSFKARLE